MDETFQTRILRFLRARKGASFQELAQTLEIPEHKLSLALGIMVQAGMVVRESTQPPTIYRLAGPAFSGVSHGGSA